MNRKNLVCVLIMSFCACASSYGADLEREKRLAQEVEAGLFTGEAVTLSYPGGEFLAIDTVPQATDKKYGAIILHGRGFHPDWPDVIAPLRIFLPEHGWRTLSIQLPVLDKEAKYYDYVPIFPESYPRIESAISYLRKQGIEKIALIAHSCGVHMAMAWIREKGDSSIDAFIGIGMGATDYQQPMKQPFPLDKMKVPVLDIYGDQEYPAVLRDAPVRFAAIQKAGNPRSKQISVTGADHYFRNNTAPKLNEEVLVWLKNAW
jgi:hypothetical protein